MKIPKLLFLIPLLMFLLNACSKEDENEGDSLSGANEEIENPSTKDERVLISGLEYTLPSSKWADNLTPGNLLIINSQEELQQYISGAAKSEVDFSEKTMLFLRLKGTYQIESVKPKIEKEGQESYYFSMDITVNPWKISDKMFDICLIIDKMPSKGKLDLELNWLAGDAKNPEDCSCGSKKWEGMNMLLNKAKFYTDTTTNGGLSWGISKSDVTFPCVIYYPKTNKAWYSNGVGNYGQICNLPEAAKQWNSDSGIDILLKGEDRDISIDPGYSPNYVFNDLVLTFFEKE